MSLVRRGNQTGSIVRPQSRFVVCGMCWMYRASNTLLLVRLVLTYLTVADTHFFWCPVSPATTEHLDTERWADMFNLLKIHPFLPPLSSCILLLLAGKPAFGGLPCSGATTTESRRQCVS